MPENDHQRSSNQVFDAANSTNVDDAVGRALNSFRLRAKLTIRALSERAGVSSAMISRIENGQVSPSLSTLQALSNALDLPMINLFQHTIDAVDVTHVKAGAGMTSRRHAKGNRHDFQILGYHKRQDIRFEPLLITLSKDDINDAQHLYHQNGCQFVYVLEGELYYHYGDSTYHLLTGDSLSFDTAGAHRIGDLLSPTVKLLVVFAQRL